jgi:hypothetical protein
MYDCAMSKPKHPSVYAASKKIAFCVPGNHTGTLDALARELQVQPRTLSSWINRGGWPRVEATAAVAWWPESGVTVAELTGVTP